MSPVPSSPVVVFVNFTVKTVSLGELAGYGVYFDSTRWQHLNSSDVLTDPYSLRQDGHAAIWPAILYVLRRVPRYHSLTIETDCSGLDKDVHTTLIRRQRGTEPEGGRRTGVEEDVFDLIEMRTHRSGYFVDIIFSGDDPSAKRGLAAARSLALSALNAYSPAVTEW